MTIAKTLSQLPQSIRFGREICGQLDQAERREWWLTNGRGAYASGTVAGTLTRRYHGLLIAPLSPPLGRFLVFAKADATLLDGDRTWPLFTNRWSDGTLSPRGDRHLESFRLDGRLPVWQFAIGNRRLEQRLWMDQGTDQVHLAWRLLSGGGERPLRLQVDLLVNARDHHGVTDGDRIQPDCRVAGDRLRVVHADWFALEIQAHGGGIRADPVWIENFDLPVERERGLEDRDNHLRAGVALLDLPLGEWVGLSAEINRGTDIPPVDERDTALPFHRDGWGRIRPPRSHDRQQTRDRQLLEQARTAHPAFADAPDWIRQLILAADAFLFARPLAEVPDGESAIAGYPWFGDWGRDTMIALPGLALATGRPASARRILLTFARFVDAGMLPNCFPGAGETPAYNSVDAALWYLDAWRAYVEATEDTASLTAAFPVLESIVDAYCAGTRHGIRMDPTDGLIQAGEPGIQLTWMDAKVDDWVVTPRIGKPVEINALWYNALIVMRDFAARLGRDPSRYAELAERVAAGFQRYLRADGEGLLDLLDGPAGADASVRPNQILAVSLHASPLARADQARVVDGCGQILLTSYGLRSLAPGEPEYRGRYRGGIRERDGAYHQGTVWCWLLGHYALAEYRVTGDANLARSRLTPLSDHLRDAGLGSLSEIFDGDPPHQPRGAPLQAWSVACTLDAWRRIGD
ncbi:amylo-alpha-1,6-glucosidase [Thiocystis violascens]|uniref:Glycogen debranching enzyme n=1 Tax=Thiocystis violascens (strain ATCC 17096 / DSM 198 / 6111) TaxID=765911 RepID=I3Y683_THIV6|nr:amylo-alpha-1,6-glucosidase [Thiocystis violascens]AFL72501.1 glycogen debranching enzyme [Thiocystis violascens DSM 198]